ncbi:MAG TPA: hypothetical protein VJ813_15435 [Vicinamibacterales bacterium]|nr:hypothetical protein [Vicinamibacterales bacterium]
MPVTQDRRLEVDSHIAFDHVFPTSVTITRTSEEDWKSRQLVVAIDGKRVGELLWGDSMMCELAAGPHTLRVHNTLVWRTARFVVAPGEQVFYEAINRAGASTYFLLPIFGIGPLYVKLRRMA